MQLLRLFRLPSIQRNVYLQYPASNICCHLKRSMIIRRDKTDQEPIISLPKDTILSLLNDTINENRDSITSTFKSWNDNDEYLSKIQKLIVHYGSIQDFANYKKWCEYGLSLDDKNTYFNHSYGTYYGINKDLDKTLKYFKIAEQHANAEKIGNAMYEYLCGEIAKLYLLHQFNLYLYKKYMKKLDQFYKDSNQTSKEEPSWSSYFGIAEKYLHSQQFQDAIKMYKQCQSVVQFDSIVIRRRIADCLVALRDDEKAKEYCSECIELYPEDLILNVKYNQCVGNLHPNDPQMVLDLYLKIQEIFDTHTVILTAEESFCLKFMHIKMGQLYIQLGQKDKAKIYLEKSMNTEDESSTPFISYSAHYLYGTILWEENGKIHNDESIKYLIKAAELMEDNTRKMELYLDIAEYYRTDIKTQEKAVECFKRILEMDKSIMEELPNKKLRFDMLINVGLWETHLESTNGREYFEEAMNIKEFADISKQPNIYLEFGKYLFEIEENRKDAMLNFKKAENLDDKNVEIYEWITKSYLSDCSDKLNVKKGEMTAKIGLQLDENNGKLNGMLGLLEMTRGDGYGSKIALEYLKKAIQYAPADKKRMDIVYVMQTLAILSTLKDDHESINVCKLILQHKSGTFTMIIKLLVKSLYNIGNYKECLEYCDALKHKHPKDYDNEVDEIRNKCLVNIS